jgi:hypothetical protein
MDSLKYFGQKVLMFDYEEYALSQSTYAKTACGNAAPRLWNNWCAWNGGWNWIVLFAKHGYSIF